MNPKCHCRLAVWLSLLSSCLSTSLFAAVHILVKLLPALNFYSSHSNPFSIHSIKLSVHLKNLQRHLYKDLFSVFLFFFLYWCHQLNIFTSCLGKIWGYYCEMASVSICLDKQAYLPRIDVRFTFFNDNVKQMYVKICIYFFHNFCEYN